MPVEGGKPGRLRRFSGSYTAAGATPFVLGGLDTYRLGAAVVAVDAGSPGRLRRFSGSYTVAAAAACMAAAAALVADTLGALEATRDVAALVDGVERTPSRPESGPRKARTAAEDAADACWPGVVLGARLGARLAWALASLLLPAEAAAGWTRVGLAVAEAEADPAAVSVDGGSTTTTVDMVHAQADTTNGRAVQTDRQNRAHTRGQTRSTRGTVVAATTQYSTHTRGDFAA